MLKTTLSLDSVDEIRRRFGKGVEREFRTRVHVSYACSDEPVRRLERHSVWHGTAGYVRMRGVWLRAMLAE
ncbi:hypothetical protein OG840_29505 [Streptomyces sp. NBC_01764]|uniref:hypothetical protein n=1 Tax=Streptomyces sp. NBC_01764 TaxID=2975935 RepID=UPI00224DA0E4|nr:hypothetical protein [Streptomyces sp. NBC_01764]MCX4405633.1 hypothetical protein [Streptomyces sp. NBC_01764]